jgi:hypothetical protein
MKGGSHTIEILGLVHYDVSGLAKTTSLGGVWYFLIALMIILEKHFVIS